MPFNPVTGKDDLEQIGYQNPVPVVAEKPANDIDSFLNIIEQIESNGGKNMNHPTMAGGIHDGQAAMGRFGLMPNTIKEVANRARISGNITDPMRNIAGMEDSLAMKKAIEGDPALEREFARRLAEKVLGQFPDQQMAAYSWNQGHNLTPEKVEKRNYKDSDYVKKFNKLREMLIAGKS